MSSVPDPEIDLPRGIGGGSDVWDQPQASVVLDADFFDAASGGGATPLVYRSYLWNSFVDAISSTFTGMAIGTAASDRWVVAAVLINHNTSRSVASVTIGGVSAVELYEAPVLTANGITMSFWKANVPTGTTANVVVTANAGTWFDGAVALYTCTGEPTLFASAHDNTYTGTTFDVTVNVPYGGAVIGLVRNDGAGALSGWTGATADQTDETNRAYVASANSLAGQTSRPVSFTTTAASTTTGFFGLAVVSLAIPTTTGGSASGTASGTLSLSGSATGTALAAGAASGILGLSGSATGTVVSAGGASGTAAGDLPLTGSASGVAPAVGQANGLLPLTGSATGVAPTAGAGSGSLLLTGAATGATRATGTAAGDLPLTGSASGTVAAAGSATGTATGTLPLSGTASGVAPVQGQGSGSIALTGAAAGAAQARGSASGSLPLSGASTGQVAAGGAASGALPLTGAGAGAALVRGVASGSIDLTGQAAGGLVIPSPIAPERIAVLSEGARLVVVPALADRVAVAFQEGRSVAVPALDRTYVVEALNRVVFATEEA